MLLFGDLPKKQTKTKYGSLKFLCITGPYGAGSLKILLPLWFSPDLGQTS